MKTCAIVQRDMEIRALRRLARDLHIALNQVMAGTTLEPEHKENLDENISFHIGPHYEDVVDE
jgi:hypothetical protein